MTVVISSFAGSWASRSGSIPRRFARTGGAYRLDIADMAGRDLDGPDPQCFLVDSEVDPAPHAPFRATKLARVPLTFAFHLGASAVHEQMQLPEWGRRVLPSSMPIHRREPQPVGGGSFRGRRA